MAAPPPLTTYNQADLAIEPAHSTSPLYSVASTSRVSPALLAIVSTPLRRASPTHVVASPGYPRTPQRARLPCVHQRPGPARGWRLVLYHSAGNHHRRLGVIDPQALPGVVAMRRSVAVPPEGVNRKEGRSERGG